MARLTALAKELAALNERLAREPDAEPVELAPRERPNVKLVQRSDGHEWLTVDGVPVKRRVVGASRE
jgi:hypothetical protein